MKETARQKSSRFAGKLAQVAEFVSPQGLALRKARRKAEWFKEHNRKRP